MKGIRIFYHLERKKEGFLGVYSSFPEVEDKVVSSMLPTPSVLLLGDWKELSKFFSKFFIKLEVSLLKTRYPIKRYFLNEKSLSEFCYLASQVLTGRELELIRNVSVASIPLLPDSHLLEYDPIDLLSGALKIFGDEELSQEVYFVSD